MRWSVCIVRVCGCLHGDDKQRGVRRSPGATTRWCSLSSAPWSCVLLPPRLLLLLLLLWWWCGERVLLPPRLVLPRGDMDADDDDDEAEDDDDNDDDAEEEEEEDTEGVDEEDEEDEDEEQLEYGLSKASGVGVRWWRRPCECAPAWRRPWPWLRLRPWRWCRAPWLRWLRLPWWRRWRLWRCARSLIARSRFGCFFVNRNQSRKKRKGEKTPTNRREQKREKKERLRTKKRNE